MKLGTKWIESCRWTVAAVRVYDCSQMAVNCGRCRATSSRYDCGWCLHTQSCSVQRTCRPESWISRTQLCPDPLVTKVYSRCVVLECPHSRSHRPTLSTKNSTSNHLEQPHSVQTIPLPRYADIDTVSAFTRNVFLILLRLLFN